MIPTLLYVLFTTHVTIALVTIYFHRAQAHRSLTCSPLFDKFARTWLWFFTGQVTTEWVSVHRKHHAKCETKEDPHSPKILGTLNVLFLGVWHYKKAARDPQTIEKYSQGCPKDKLEQFFTNHSTLGLILLYIMNVALFGFTNGSIAYIVQILWIPLWAAGVINSLAHTFGYRNFDTPDRSANISCLGLIIGGEELHNNHHAYPTSAKLSMKKWEFDIGWFYIRILSKLHLVSDVRVVTFPSIAPVTTPLAQQEVVTNFLRHQHYYKKMLNKSFKNTVMQEISGFKEKFKELHHFSSKKLYTLFCASEKTLTSLELSALAVICKQSERLKTIWETLQEIHKIWENRILQMEEATASLSAWAKKIEQKFSLECSAFLRNSNLSHLTA